MSVGNNFRHFKFVVGLWVWCIWPLCQGHNSTTKSRCSHTIDKATWGIWCTTVSRSWISGGREILLA